MFKKAPNNVKDFGMPCMTHEEIAQKMGISRQAVQQIEQRALAKLRAALARMGINCMDDMMVFG